MTKIHRLHSTASTNRDAYRLAEQGGEHGTAVIACEQSGGRGRLGKTWQSPPGKGLYCSIVLRPEVDILSFPQLTFVAGLAVAEAIEKLYPLCVELKWPNDIYFNWRKCGGILTEASPLNGPAENRFAIVGIGLNINTAKTDFAPELQSAATSLLLESGLERDIDSVFSAIHSQLLKEVQSFVEQGFAAVIARWKKRDFMLGERMLWVNVSGEAIEGVSLGPDGQGRLHVKDDQGCEHEILSGDIRLVKPG